MRPGGGDLERVEMVSVRPRIWRRFGGESGK